MSDENNPNVPVLKVHVDDSPQAMADGAGSAPIVGGELVCNGVHQSLTSDAVNAIFHTIDRIDGEYDLDIRDYGHQGDEIGRQHNYTTRSLCTEDDGPALG